MWLTLTFCGERKAEQRKKTLRFGEKKTSAENSETFNYTVDVQHFLFIKHRQKRVKEMERQALRWQKLCPTQTLANFNTMLTILSLQWPFRWQPLKIYTAELCCSCLSISIISYSSCCSAQWLSSHSGVFTPPQPRLTSFSSLYSWKRLDCSSSAVWPLFLPLGSFI